jgi:aminoglycoside 3-N-acetyltransferase I
MTVQPPLKRFQTNDEPPTTQRLVRLVAGDRALARKLFAVMAGVFEEECERLSDEVVDRLLARPEFWAIAAFSGDEIVGGVTAHTLPMTRRASFELFIYDVAVRAEHQRMGIGRQLVNQLRSEAAVAGIFDVFVAADDDDLHALDFYRAIGGVASPVTMFTFTGRSGADCSSPASNRSPV